ncbi:MAG: efflux RND transporter periplasmic adaptor subunit [Gammaproteobacteria bacterium]
MSRLKTITSGTEPARWICAVLVLSAIAACSKSEPPPPPPPEVQVAKVERRTVPHVIKRVAQTESSREVAVVARVSGFLEKIAYVEGSLLQEGDVMFQMDRKPFLSEVDAAKGELEAQKARLWTANANLNRTRPLAEADALSQSDLDQAIGEQKAAEAAVYSARARLDNAKLNLGYTTIHAPVTGLSGRAEQREGAYLNSLGASASLSYVSQTDPMWINFSVSQNEQEGVVEEQNAGKLVLPPDSEYKFEIMFADGSVYPYQGTLNFLAPTFDNETGTFSVRAVVENPDDRLRPGMFVTVNVLGMQRPDAVVIPRIAVQQTSNGQVVWLVNAEGKTEMRPVVMGDWAGDDWVVQSGLSGGETLIVSGVNRIRPGVPVKAVPASAGKQAPTPAKSGS